MSAFKQLLLRDMKLALRDGGAIGTVLGFDLIVVALMPLGLGPDLALLARTAPAILWIAFLLASLLSVSRLFEADYEDGSLDVLMVGPLPIELVALAKMLAHWLTVSLPLILLSPAVGLLLNLDGNLFGLLVVSLILGTPTVSAISTLGAALTLRARRGGLLVALLVLPMFVPTLIFGMTALSSSVSPSGPFSSLLMLAAISLVSIVFVPIAIAAALRVQVG
jgi:heme exporter protein B